MNSRYAFQMEEIFLEHKPRQQAPMSSSLYERREGSGREDVRIWDSEDSLFRNRQQLAGAMSQNLRGQLGSDRIGQMSGGHQQRQMGGQLSLEMDGGRQQQRRMGGQLSMERDGGQLLRQMGGQLSMERGVGQLRGEFDGLQGRQVQGSSLFSDRSSRLSSMYGSEPDMMTMNNRQRSTGVWDEDYVNYDGGSNRARSSQQSSLLGSQQLSDGFVSRSQYMNQEQRQLEFTRRSTSAGRLPIGDRTEMMPPQNQLMTRRNFLVNDQIAAGMGNRDGHTMRHVEKRQGVWAGAPQQPARQGQPWNNRSSGQQNNSIRHGNQNANVKKQISGKTGKITKNTGSKPATSIKDRLGAPVGKQQQAEKKVQVTPQTKNSEVTIVAEKKKTTGPSPKAKATPDDNPPKISYGFCEKEFTDAKIKPDYMSCKDCGCNPNNIRNCISHLRSKRHAKATFILMEEAKNRLVKMREVIKLIENTRTANLPETKEEPSYCKDCDVKVSGNIALHNAKAYHRNLVKYVRPTCGVCKMTFSSREGWEKHRFSLQHVKTIQEKKIEIPLCPESDDVFIKNLEFLSRKHGLDRVDTDAKETATAEHCEQEKQNKPGDKAGENEVYNPNKMVGEDMLLRVTGRYCKLCKLFLLKNSDIQQHLRSRQHFDEYLLAKKSAPPATKSAPGGPSPAPAAKTTAGEVAAMVAAIQKRMKEKDNDAGTGTVNPEPKKTTKRKKRKTKNKKPLDLSADDQDCLLLEVGSEDELSDGDEYDEEDEEGVDEEGEQEEVVVVMEEGVIQTAGSTTAEETVLPTETAKAEEQEAAMEVEEEQKLDEVVEEKPQVQPVVEQPDGENVESMETVETMES